MRLRRPTGPPGDEPGEHASSGPDSVDPGSLDTAPPRREQRPSRGAGHSRGARAAALITSAIMPALALPAALATGAAAAGAAPGPAPVAPVLTGAEPGLSPIPGQGPPTDPVYRLAGGCYTLQVVSPGPDGGNAGGYVARKANGYGTTADAAGAEKFRTKAAQLGRFLFLGTDGAMITESDLAGLPVGGAVVNLQDILGGGRGSGVVIAKADATPGADWRVDYAASPDPTVGGTYGLSNTVSGTTVIVDPGTGALRAVPAAGSGTGGPAGARFRLAAADGCAAFPEAPLDVHGPPHTGTDGAGNVTGRVDAHMHMAEDGYIGGKVHCGRNESPLGITVALADCPDHEPQGAGALLENIISHSTPIALHDTTGWPTFAGYPEAASLTHEQTYYRWVERAWRSGLRITSNLLVTNGVLCTIYWQGDAPCGGMDVARLQMRQLHEMQDYIDAQYGGPGRGWYRIVETPEQARAVIESGRLAVVPGIEVSDIAGCSLSNGTPDCTEADIDAGLDELKAMGVRQAILVHKFDNALGGTRMDSDFNGLAVNVGNMIATGHFWQVQPCTGEAVDNTQPLRAPGAEDVAGILPPGSTLPVYPDGPSCNQRGLTDLGRYAVHGLMDRSMIVDVDHMGAKTADETLDILEQAGYHRVISSHSWTDPHNYPRILALGGFIALMANQDDDQPGYVDRWRALRAQVPDGAFFGVGRSSDVNGFAAQVPPPSSRYPDAPQVSYPYTAPDGTVMDEQRTGERVFDFNTDGVAEYGLYPDWVEYLRLRAAQTGDESDAEQLMSDLSNGAEAYLRMWAGPR